MHVKMLHGVPTHSRYLRDDGRYSIDAKFQLWCREKPPRLWEFHNFSWAVYCVWTWRWKLKLKTTCAPFRAQLKISLHWLNHLSFIVLFIGCSLALMSAFETTENTQLWGNMTGGSLTHTPVEQLHSLTLETLRLSNFLVTQCWHLSVRSGTADQLYETHKQEPSENSASRVKSGDSESQENNLTVCLQVHFL